MTHRKLGTLLSPAEYELQNGSSEPQDSSGFHKNPPSSQAGIPENSVSVINKHRSNSGRIPVAACTCLSCFVFTETLFFVNTEQNFLKFLVMGFHLGYLSVIKADNCLNVTSVNRMKQIFLKRVHL